MKGRNLKKTYWRLGILVSFLATGLSIYAQEPEFHLEGMVSCSLPVTGRKMTNVVFPIDIAAGVRVSRDVLVQKVRGIENVIELKALKRDFAPTSLAVYGKDGRLYPFVLHYVEDTAVLDYRVIPDGGFAGLKVRLSGWPVEPERLRSDAQMLADRRGFLHRHSDGSGLRLRLRGIYVQDSLLWLGLEVQNRSPIDCKLDDLRIYTEDRKKIRRRATQEVDVSPLYREVGGGLPGFSRRALAVALRPFLVGPGKRLVIRVSDESGDRQVVLKVKRRWLLRARNCSEDQRFADEVIATQR